MLFPKKVKYKKQFKGKIKGKTSRGNKIIFGNYALKGLEEGRLTSRQLESGRRSIVRHMKRLGFLWIRIFPSVPVTSKPSEIRMGKGKGSVNYWVSKVKKGQIIYEISGVSYENSIKALRSGSTKLPVKTTIIEKKGLQFNWLERTAHNGVVVGSSPTKPNKINYENT